jgi:hypothetical protein
MYKCHIPEEIEFLKAQETFPSIPSAIVDFNPDINIPIPLPPIASPRQ